MQRADLTSEAISDCPSGSKEHSCPNAWPWRTAELSAAASMQTGQRVGPQRAAKVQAAEVLRQSSVDLQDNMDDDSSAPWQGSSHQVQTRSLLMHARPGSSPDSYMQNATLNARERIQHVHMPLD